MYAPSGAVGPDGKLVDLWWFNVAVEDERRATDVEGLIAAIEQFRSVHSESAYHEAVREIMRQTGATRKEVRAAMSESKGRDQTRQR